MLDGYRSDLTNTLSVGAPTDEQQMLDLEMDYAEKFDDVLPPNKVTRLFQAENKLETAMMMEIAKDVPLAK